MLEVRLHRRQGQIGEYPAFLKIGVHPSSVSKWLLVSNVKARLPELLVKPLMAALREEAHLRSPLRRIPC